MASGASRVSSPQLMRPSTFSWKACYHEEMRPIRNALLPACLKLHNMGSDIVCMFEKGYLLIPRRRKRSR